MRLSSQVKRNDLLDLMIDALKQDADILKKEDNEHKEDQFEADSKLDHKRKGKKELDEILIIATAMVMLVAGYDTTAQTLAWACWRLFEQNATPPFHALLLQSTG